MKYMTLLLILISGLSALAQTQSDTPYGRGSTTLEDSDIGRVEIRSSDVNETVDVLNVFVLCNDKRRLKNSVTPKWEKVPELSNIQICFNWPKRNRIDPSTKVLSVNYSMKAIASQGYNLCNTHLTTEIDLAKFCAPWRN